MLMYRQIDKERNVEVMKVEEFPDHIKVGDPIRDLAINLILMSEKMKNGNFK